MEFLIKNDALVLEEVCRKSSKAREILAAILRACTPQSPAGARAYRTTVPLEASAELQVSTRLSQRSYNTTRKLLKRQGVHISPYRKASRYLRDLDVGLIAMGQHEPATPRHERHEETMMDCMCASTEVIDTLQQVLSKLHFYSRMQFPTPEMQQRLFPRLLARNPVLYQNLRPELRTILLRQTGDNFRSFRLPTQQMSFSLLNLVALINSPAGQFLEVVFRGKENRQSIARHTSSIFRELNDLAMNGITLVKPDGSQEEFNVLVFYIADAAHVLNVLGRVNCNAKFGCYLCKKPTSDWRKLGPTAAPITMGEMITFGQEALKVLGPNPREGMSRYTEFHHDHFGVIAVPLLRCLVDVTTPPCGLHLILAIHRLFWKAIFNFASSRNQIDLIPKALKRVGCYYMAHQMVCYQKAKGKCYDGSTTLRQTGNDCKRLEANISNFLKVFLKPGETFDDPRATKLRQLQTAVTKWIGIAHDIRSPQTTTARVESFQRRVEEFTTYIVKYFANECSDKMFYFHVLHDHIGAILKFWFETLEIGYGFFTATAGEHENKRCKVFEQEHTYQNATRFRYLIHTFRVQQFVFPTCLFAEQTSKITCSACGTSGHNKRNKICPAYVDAEPVEFNDSEDETAD